MPNIMESTGLSPTFMDTAQLVTWSVAILGGLVTAWKALREAKQARDLRQQDLRWRKAELARNILTEFQADRKIQDTMTMLDWNGRDYQVAPGMSTQIHWSELDGALRTATVTGFSDKEVYIRDCFDAFFDGIERIEHYLRTGLVNFEDVAFPLEYWVEKIRRFGKATLPFADHYGFDLVRPFLGRFRDSSGSSST